jgi:hypothetical protein
MKTPFHCFSRRSLAPLLAGALVLASFSGCTKQDQQKVGDTIKNSYDDSKAALAKAWDNVKDYSFDKRDEFTANAKALAAKAEVQVSEARANFSEAKASASRKAAMEELKNAEADYKEKLKALGNATADTWDVAKKNVMLAWDRLQAAYYKARAD